MSYVIDTNVLARSIHQNHPFQQLAIDSIKTLLAQGENLCVLSQNLYEFWVIATRPLLQNGLGLSMSEVSYHLARFETVFLLKSDTPDIYQEWKNLVTRHVVAGKPAHDARIVAAMKVHGITHLLTFNGDDFKRFSEITVVSPDNLLAQLQPSA